MSRFRIFDAVKKTYAFAGREASYLLKISIVPLALQIATSFFLRFAREDASVFEAYLWGLPATIFSAWFVFLSLRLLLLDERLGRLPTDIAFLQERHLAMRLFILMFVLFNMGMTAALVALAALTQNPGWQENPAVAGITLFLIGGVIWAVRFSIAPVLASVLAPIRPAFRKLDDMLLPLRLIGLGVVTLMPLALLFVIVFEVFFGASVEKAETFNLTPTQEIAFILLDAPMSLLTVLLLNVAIAFALKEMLGQERRAA